MLQISYKSTGLWAVPQMQRSPPEWLHSREMHTKLNIAGLLGAAFDISMQLDIRKIFNRNNKNIQHIQINVVLSKIWMGSFVRVQKPGILQKREPRFMSPLKTAAKKGPYAYKLSDGWVWNFIHLAPTYQEQSRDVSDHLTGPMILLCHWQYRITDRMLGPDWRAIEPDGHL